MEDKSSLADACRKGRLDLLKKHLAECQENPFQTGSTSLFNIASESNDCGLDVLEELITTYRIWSKRAQRKGKGSGLVAYLRDSRTPEGYTALHYACKSNKLDFVYVFVKELCFFGIPAMDTAVTATTDAITPFDVACRYGCIRIALFLLQKCRCYYEDFSMGLIVADQYGNTKLITEVCKIHKVTVKVLNSLCKQKRHDIVDFCITKKLCKQEGWQLLEMAVSRGEIELMTYLSESFDIKSVDKNGNNLLHVACSANQLGSVEWLLKHRHSMAMSRNQKDERPISIALKNEFDDIVECFEGILQLNPFHLFCIRQEVKTSMSSKEKKTANDEFRKIAKSTPDPTSQLQQDKCGNSPLHYACDNGQLGFIRLLLKAPMLDLSVQNVDGNTPVHLFSQQMCKINKALEANSRKTRKRSQPSVLRKRMITCLQKMISHPTFNPCICNAEKETVVFILLTELNLEFNEVFNSLLDIAVKHYSSDALNQDVVRIVKHHCQKHRYNQYEKNSKQQEHPFVTFISKLTKTQHFNPNTADSNGNTCLHFATACYWAQLVEHLLKIPQVSVIAENASGETPLQNILKIKMYSPINIDINFCSIVAQLIDQKVLVDFEPFDDEGNTLLHIACFAKSATLLEKLVQMNGIKGVLNVLNKKGKSPLHLLCSHAKQYIDVKCFELLLSFVEIDVNLCTESKKLPLEILTSNGNQNSIMYEEMKRSIVLISEHSSFKSELYAKPHFLMMWCKAGVVKLVKRIISKDTSLIEKLNRFRQNLLHVACLNFNSKMVEFLMSLKTSEKLLLARDHYQRTPFHSLCWKVSVSRDDGKDKEKNNQALKVFQILENNESLHHVINDVLNVNGKAPLHLLSKVRHFNALFKAVLNVSTINVNVKDSSSNRPLHIACREKVFKKVEILLKHPEIDITVINGSGQTPLSYFRDIPSHLTCQKDRILTRLKISPRTLKHTPDYDFMSTLISEDIHEKNPALFEDLSSISDSDHNTALHVACQLTKKSAILMLLSKPQISVRCVNKQLKTALHIFLDKIKQSDDSHLQILNSFKAHSSYSSGLLRMKDKDGNTCFHLACKTSAMEQFIFDSLELVTAMNGKGDTPLHTACNHAQVKSVFLLLQHESINVRAVNAEKQTVFHVIANTERKKEGYEIYCQLKMHRSFGKGILEMQDSNGDTCLHIACRSGNQEMIADMCRQVHVNSFKEKNCDGETILHIACAYIEKLVQKEEIIDSMLSISSCDPNIINEQKKTPFHVLAANDCKTFDKLCRKHNRIDLGIRDGEQNTPLHVLFSSLQDSNSLKKLNFNSDPVFDISLACSSSPPTAYDISDLSAVNKNGDTALHMACMIHFGYFVEVLSKAMSNINLRNKEGKTPFHSLYIDREEQFFDECWQILVSHPSFNPNVQDKQGLTVLHYECMLSNPEFSLLTALLEQKDINVSLSNNSGDTCLNLAQANFSTENLNKLIKLLNQKSTETAALPFELYFSPYHGIYGEHHDLEQCHKEITESRSLFSARSRLDQQGNTALHLACQAVCPKAIKRLLPSCRKKMADFPLNRSKQTPLHMLALGIKRQFTFLLSKSSSTKREKELSAMRKKVRALMKYDWYVLLQCGINKKDDSGNTALHYVCEAQSVAMLKILTFNRSCRFDIRNNIEDMPIAVAQRTRNRSFFLKVLIKYFEKQDNQHLATYYKTVLKDGAIPMRPVKCILTGPPAAGKSTLKRRLLGEAPLENSTSTGLADSPQVVAVRNISQEQVSVSSGGMKWTSVDCRDQVEALLQTLLSNIQDAIEKNVEPSHFLTSSIHADSQSNGATASQHVADFRKTIVCRYKEWDEKQNTLTTVTRGKKAKKREIFEHQVKELHMLVNSVPAKKSKDERKKFSVGGLNENPFVRIIDTGGQPELHELLPAFVTGPAVNLIVFRLDKPLEEHYPIYYRSEKRDSLHYKSSLSHKDMILRSLASIACLGYGQQLKHTDDDKTVEPVAFLIASHKDQVDDEDVNLTNEQVESLIRSGDLAQKDIVKYCDEECIIFAVNNLDEECHEIDILRSKIFDAINREFTPIYVPMTWLIFSIKLQVLIEKKSIEPVIDIDRCFEIAQTCGIPPSKNHLKDALWFFHNAMGIVMYYPEIPELTSKVILDIQAIFNCITQLVTNCFLYETIGSKPAQEDFAKHGYFTLKSLKKVVQSKNVSKSKDNIPFTAEEIIALMDHLYVIAPIQNNTYFMPSTLKPTKLDQVDHNLFSLPPLLVSFECGYCPVGVFTSLVAYLLSPTNIELKCRLSDSDQFRNRIKICVGPYDHEVTLVTHANYFEVRLYRTSFGTCTNLTDVAQQIRALIDGGITTVTRSLHYKYSSQHYFGFACNNECCRSFPIHPAIYESAKADVRVVRCVRTKTVLPLTPEQLEWYGIEGESLTGLGTVSIDDIPGEILDKVLDLKDLDEVLNLLKDLVGWKPLGLQLGLKGSTLHKIDSQERQIVNACTLEMLAYWLRGADNVTSKGRPTWRKLITALQKGKSKEDPIIASHILVELKQKAN